MNEPEFIGFDSEPEDAWHPGDSIAELLDNLDARCTLLGERRQVRQGATEREKLAELAERLARLYRRRRELTELQQVKVLLIDEDLVFIRRRIEAI